MPDNHGEIKKADDNYPKTKHQWFRFYSEALNDHKVQSLDPTIFKGWVNLLCLANECGGELPSIDEIAFKLRLSQHSARELIDVLIMQGLIDIQADNTLVPHNWSGRQFKSDVSTERVRKHRENRRNVSGETKRNVSETPPDTDTDTDTEADTEERKKDCLVENSRKPRAKTDAGNRNRGARLPHDWILPDDWVPELLAKFPQFDRSQIQQQADAFRDYWTSKPGATACKLDWRATFRNWLRNSRPQRPGQGGQQPQAFKSTIDRTELDKELDELRRKAFGEDSHVH